MPSTRLLRHCLSSPALRRQTLPRQRWWKRRLARPPPPPARQPRPGNFGLGVCLRQPLPGTRCPAGSGGPAPSLCCCVGCAGFGFAGPNVADTAAPTTTTATPASTITTTNPTPRPDNNGSVNNERRNDPNNTAQVRRMRPNNGQLCLPTPGGRGQGKQRTLGTPAAAAKPEREPRTRGQQRQQQHKHHKQRTERKDNGHGRTHVAVDVVAAKPPTGNVQGPSRLMGPRRLGSRAVGGRGPEGSGERAPSRSRCPKPRSRQLSPRACRSPGANLRGMGRATGKPAHSRDGPGASFPAKALDDTRRRQARSRPSDAARSCPSPPGQVPQGSGDTRGQGPEDSRSHTTNGTPSAATKCTGTRAATSHTPSKRRSKGTNPKSSLGHAFPGAKGHGHQALSKQSAKKESNKECFFVRACFSANPPGKAKRETGQTTKNHEQAAQRHQGQAAQTQEAQQPQEAPKRTPPEAHKTQTRRPDNTKEQAAHTKEQAAHTSRQADYKTQAAQTKEQARTRKQTRTRKQGAKQEQTGSFGITAAHRQRQNRIMDEMAGTNSPAELVQKFEKYRLGRVPAIKWSTVAVKIGTFHGSCRRLPLPQREFYSAMLSDPLFRDYEAEVGHRRLEEEVRFPTPLAKAHVHAVLSRLRAAVSYMALSFLLVCWATTQRPRCISKLQLRNITFDKAKNKFTAKFVEGKGVRMRKMAFTVATSTGPWAQIFDIYISTRRNLNAKFLFPQDSFPALFKKIRDEMRQHNQTYEMRSPRRGALQEMALAGATVKTLMAFSGHSKTETLLRYLDWGFHLVSRHRRTVKQSKVLF